MRNETRFRMVEKLDPERFKKLSSLAEKQAEAARGHLPAAGEPHRSPDADDDAEADTAPAKK